MERNGLSFGKNLAEKRISLKMSREELATKAGISLSMLSKIERDETNPTIVVASKLARSLKTTVSALLGERADEFHVGDVQSYIRDLRDAEDKLEKAIEGYRKLVPDFRATFHRVYVYDAECRFLLASAAGTQRIGLTVADFTGKHWRELGLPAEVMADFERNVRTVFATGNPIHTETMFPSIDGLDFYDYYLTPLFSDNGIVEAVMAISWNITNTKLTELELMNKSEGIGQLIGNQAFDISINRLNFLAVFAHSVDAILLTTPSGKVLDANPAACRMFGMSREELLVRGRRVVDETDPHLSAALEERSKNGFGIAELRFVRRDGSKFFGEVASNIFQTSTGEVYTSMIIRDITGRRGSRSDER